VSAKTRSWEEAEKFAQHERDRRDPIKKRLLEIEEQEAQKVELQSSQNITVTIATDRWLRSLKAKTEATSIVQKRAAWRICAWAKDVKIINVHEITPAALDEWRGMWGEEAEKEYSRIGPTSQSTFQGRLRQFCRWAVAMGHLRSDPTASFKGIPKGKEVTQPLTATQFLQLFDAIKPFTASQPAEVEVKDFAKELKALFLLQRWAGLRILDCLMLPRTGLVGNRLSLITKKTGAKIENRIIPDYVAEALVALSPDRPTFRPGHFFWNIGRKNWTSLTTKWTQIIKGMAPFLNFKHPETGEPMGFHSHMLRDTYAVELLLAGVALEDVSKLLTHTSIKTTEKHYAPWVKPRLQQLEDKSVAALRAMGVVVTA
jgi:site-specific recombinase XerD